MKKVILFLLVVGIIAGYCFIKYKPGLSAHKRLLSPQDVTDVVELKSGKKIIGKILKESPDSIFIRYADGTTEAVFLKKLITNTRKATPEDLIIAQNEADKAQENVRESLRYTQERKAELDKFYEERYKKEVASHAKDSSQMKAAEAMTEARRSGKVCAGMSQSDVTAILGTPCVKKVNTGGNAPKEKWEYGGDDQQEVKFYDGKVVTE